MSRPKPTIIMQNTHPRTYKNEQVLKADAIYAVFLDGKPINLRSMHAYVNDPGPKYKKVSFSNPGHAFNLAEKLNKMFQTDKFQVYMLTEGKLVTEADL